MLQKDVSNTTSSKFVTNKSRRLTLESSIQYLKGVGPKLAQVFESRGMRTVGELLTFFPRHYQDRTHVSRVNELTDGMNTTVKLKVVGARRIPLRGGKSIFEVRGSDGAGTLALKWFHAPRSMEERFRSGVELVASGVVKKNLYGLEMLHPEITVVNASSALTAAETGATPESENYGRMVPVYVEIEGIPTRSIRKILWSALEKAEHLLTESLPTSLVKKHQLPTKRSAVRSLHFPEPNASIDDLVSFRTPAHARLIYEEFFVFEYLVLKSRLNLEKESGPKLDRMSLTALTQDRQNLAELLPFKLTQDQIQTLSEIEQDFTQPHPMNRLLQGDVGSGKTLVAFLAAAPLIARGGQVALMAPTEILAEQHFKTALKFFGTKLNTALLTGSTSNKERTALLSRLTKGEPLLLIGTHALIEPDVQFKQLCLMVVDEQHRFGVEQRRQLRSKTLGYTPHSLIMSATPIPRTLALSAYGDLSLSVIKELPPGRMPIKTRVVLESDRKRAYDWIASELTKGRQAYFIFPLVNESEAEGFTHLKSVIVETERLQKQVFPQFKVGLLHGKMSSQEKSDIMARFLKNEIQVLASTTVIEVGVDNPNATLIAIEHADRFGLSQLHQLRGRVGRGAHSSYCLLFTPKTVAEVADKRLSKLEETQDGFKIAETDLEIRGPGEFLGTRQSGSLPFRIADLVRDQEWLFKARNDAEELLRFDPELTRIEQAPFKEFLNSTGQDLLERFRTF